MLSLYIHIPYCVGKCRYCGFYSTRYQPEHAAAFIISLRREAAARRAELSHRVFRSIYIGGGTPTVLANEQAAQVLDIIRQHFRIAGDAEFTLEANPNTTTKQGLAAWREGGVNRLSLGVQSFSDELLGALGRPHTAAQAEDAFRLARSAGFQNIGIDLIYGIPGQTMQQWEGTLDRAVSLRPEHLSAYGLSLDEGSQFNDESAAGAFALPDDDIVADMYDRAVATLGSAGYGRYEISNFALPGFECRHNMNYWERGEYLGLGPGAWSFLSGTRFRTIADTAEYTRRLISGESAVIETESPDPEQASHETILLSFRTVNGMDLHRYRRDFGPRVWEQLQGAMAPLIAAGLLRIKEGRARLTDRGIMLSNEALSRLFS
jgi:oxygen-independent coproporphyrinogen-3 oxidase